ncbi:UDP-N-acetylmuramoyl-L-alanyl-D-glutamate--2,6-diaminopimelate ligase [Clostridium sp. 19966]|uniref:UDP-N-acetylmuramoyl-L-alanyl-D-glutamate--2, 6-diaminopimelate ligase n=1 Tax=Clostridium sp. 19966 TaxID=2768166 RepID=UPI0028DDBCD3|nr:UDP-N-acetylmuramoyl-L-alanyl-D-glutamate--2,6-diaminopimelate ligase [Clostridium sp. 19966]MDT8719482.1 UDP-N-acetylmuramoyl-L-alanyl-D-glutamate--2,6-diaminopimelate ligase [Clostridium sp. 19966]
MLLSNLLKGIEYELLQGSLSVNIDKICWDSRELFKNCLFIAVKNKNVDRHNYIDMAINSGALAIVLEKETNNIPQNVTVIRVKNSRIAMAIASNNFYDYPSHKFNLIGITGTNGKTSTSYFISDILNYSYRRCGIIGTIENNAAGMQLRTSKLNPTTPDSLELQKSFSEMINLGMTDVAMEVTSTALEMNRVYGCNFDIAVFTNLTMEHLEEHGTMENYKKAKLKLFAMCKNFVLNADDAFSKAIIKKYPDSSVLTYGIENTADLRAINIQYSIDSVSFDLSFNGIFYPVEINIPGRFTVYNALAAAASCYLSGIAMDEIVRALSNLKGVPGRFQYVRNNKDINIIIDYAHSPDGLKNILLSAREFTKGKLLLLFGCGGDRDINKRPIMGGVAGSLADYCIITSDNPRSENPDKIIKDIEEGLRNTNCAYKKITDREKAIEEIISLSASGDTIIIAGKGHENYQIVKDKTYEFNDAKIIKEYLKNKAMI